MVISRDVTEKTDQNARQLKRVRRRHTVGGTKDFGTVPCIPDNEKCSGASKSKIDDEEKENEKALRRMSLPVEVGDEEEFLGVPKSQNPKVLVSQV